MLAERLRHSFDPTVQLCERVPGAGHHRRLEASLGLQGEDGQTLPEQNSSTEWLLVKVNAAQHLRRSLPRVRPRTTSAGSAPPPGPACRALLARRTAGR